MSEFARALKKSYARGKVRAKKPTDLSTPWLAAPIVGQLSDAASTVIALKRKGAVEANPLLRPVVQKSLPLFVVLKAAVGVGAALASKTLAKGGHTRAAKVLSVLSFLAGALPAAHNMSLDNR